MEEKKSTAGNQQGGDVRMKDLVELGLRLLLVKVKGGGG